MPYFGVEGASREEEEGKCNQEEGKQVQLCRELGMGMDTREWKSPVNFVFGHFIQQSTQTIAQSHTLHTYRYAGNKAPLQCPGQLRPHQHTHNTNLGAVPLVVSHHANKGPLVLEERVVEEPVLVGGDLSW